MNVLFIMAGVSIVNFALLHAFYNKPRYLYYSLVIMRNMEEGVSRPKVQGGSQ